MKTRFLITVGLLLTALASVHAQTNFTKITSGNVVTDAGGYVYGCWADFNNDGLLDLFVSSFAQTQVGRTNVLYLNNGNGGFTKITQGDPVQDADLHIGAAAGDYDNDGNLDLVVSSGVGASSARRALLYHGNGDGSFSRVSGGSVTNQLGYFGPCTWADYDNDGFLDLFVADHGINDSGGKNLLFHNNGDGTFNKITSGAIVTNTSVGFDCVWADYDNDGFGDLLVFNNVNNAVNFLYHNNRDGTFSRISNGTVHIGSDTWSAGSPGGAWGDYDNDGFQDLFVAGNDGTPDRLYRNNTNGTFTTVTNLLRTGGTASLGGSWGDYDNDGYLDLLIRAYNGHNRVFHSNGNGTFTEMQQGPIVTDNQSNVSCWTGDWVDYDNDGFLDLFIARFNVGGTLVSNQLYHNDGNTNTWIEITLVGTVANRSAIGAKVHIHATIGGQTFWQMREIRAGGAHAAPLVAHFGLGDCTNVDTLRIEWPSGTVQEFQNVAAKQILTITEPPRLLASITNGLPQFFLKGGRGFQYEIDSSPDLFAWSPIGVLTVTNLNGMIEIVDTNPPASDRRFYRAISR